MAIKFCTAGAAQAHHITWVYDVQPCRNACVGKCQDATAVAANQPHDVTVDTNMRVVLRSQDPVAAASEHACLKLCRNMASS